MLEKLFEINALDLSRVIINYKKELNIKEDEALVLITLCNVIKDNKSNLEQVISETLDIDSIKVSNAIAHFIELGYLELKINVENGIGRETYSIKPLLDQIEIILNGNNTTCLDASDAIMYLETVINRTLSSKELEAVNDWLSNEKDIDDIKKAVKCLSLSGITITINKIERELFKVKGTTSSNMKKLDALIEKNKNGRVSK